MDRIFRLWIVLNLFELVTSAYTAAKETEIRSETVLAASYDFISRPDAQTRVKVGLSLLAIDVLDLKAQMFTSVGWLTFEWEDSRLAWNKTAKDDIEYIFSAPETIWKPEMVMDNSLNNLGVISDSDLYLRVKYTGKVKWVPPTLFTTYCEVDIAFYPYDQQKCSLDIVSWGYTLEEVKLEHLWPHINLEDFEPANSQALSRMHGEWVITKTVIESVNLENTDADGTKIVRPQLRFWVYMERRTEFYNLNVMMPMFLTSLLLVLVFVIPVESGEKLSYVLTVLLALAVFLTIITDALPATSISTSVLGLYLAAVLVLASIAVLLTVVVLYLHHKEGRPHRRSCLMGFIRFAARISCHTLTTNAYIDKPVNDEQHRRNQIHHSHQMLQNGRSKIEIREYILIDANWQEVAVVVDKFCFILFTILTVLMNVSFIIILVVGGRANSP